MRKFAVPMLLLGGLLLSGTVFAAAQEAQPAEPAATAQHEMKQETKTAHKAVKHHTKAAKHHAKTTRHHTKSVKHTKKKVQEKKPEPTPPGGGGM